MLWPRLRVAEGGMEWRARSIFARAGLDERTAASALKAFGTRRPGEEWERIGAGGHHRPHLER